MKYLKKLILYIILLLIVTCIMGCGSMTKEGNKETQIKKSFEKTLSMYPIKNLEDLYDKEGYRDEEFEKGDKGTWILYSAMNIQRKGDVLETRGMMLEVNRNTRTTSGHFIVNKIQEDKKGRPHSNKREYPVKMKRNKIFLTEKIHNDKLKKEVENFKFFSQYANFKELRDYKDGNISYNPKVPSYSAEYDLENKDYNVKQLRKRYDIPTKQAPKLILKGTGNLKGSSVGTKDVEFIFSKKQNKPIYFSDSLEYKPK